MKKSVSNLTLITSLVFSTLAQANVDYLDTGLDIQVADTENYKTTKVIWHQNADNTYRYTLYANRFWCWGSNKTEHGCLTKANESALSIPTRYLMTDQMVNNLNTEEYFDISSKNADQLVAKLWGGDRSRKIYRALTASTASELVIWPEAKPTSQHTAADLDLPEDIFTQALPFLESRSPDAELFTTEDFFVMQKIQAHALKMMAQEGGQAEGSQIYIANLILFGKVLLKLTTNVQNWLLMRTDTPVKNQLLSLNALEGYYQLYIHTLEKLSKEQRQIINANIADPEASQLIDQMYDIVSKAFWARADQIRLQERGSETEQALLKRIELASQFDFEALATDLFVGRVETAKLEEIQDLFWDAKKRWSIVLHEPEALQVGGRYIDSSYLWSMLEIVNTSDAQKGQFLQKIHDYSVVDMIFYEANLVSIEQILQANKFDELLALNQDALLTIDDFNLYILTLSEIKQSLRKNSMHSPTLQVIYDKGMHALNQHITEIVRALEKTANSAVAETSIQQQILDKALLLEQDFLDYKASYRLN